MNPAQLATMWTWCGTGVSTIIQSVPKDKVVKAVTKVAVKAAKSL